MPKERLSYSNQAFAILSHKLIHIFQILNCLHFIVYSFMPNFLIIGRSKLRPYEIKVIAEFNSSLIGGCALCTNLPNFNFDRPFRCLRSPFLSLPTSPTTTPSTRTRRSESNLCSTK